MGFLDVTLNIGGDALGVGKATKGALGLIRHAIDTRRDNPSWRARMEEKSVMARIRGARRKAKKVSKALGLGEEESAELSRALLSDSLDSENAAAVIMKALPAVRDDAPTCDIDPEWMSRFLEFSRHVYAEDMQVAWSKVLAKEANAPGAVSKRMLFLLAGLSREEAEAFRRVCSVQVAECPFLGREPSDFQSEVGVTKEDIVLLEAAGLIRDVHSDLFIPVRDEKIHAFDICGQTIWAVPFRNSSGIPVGRMEFSSDGLALMKTVDEPPADGLIDAMLDYLNGRCRFAFLCDGGYEEAERIYDGLIEKHGHELTVL